MSPEGKVKKHVKEILDEWGVFYWMPGANLYGRVGVSDFIACVEGVLVAIETKATSFGTPTVLQKRFMQSVHKAKGVAIVIHSGNYDLLTTTLRRLVQKEKL